MSVTFNVVEAKEENIFQKGKMVVLSSVSKSGRDKGFRYVVLLTEDPSSHLFTGVIVASDYTQDKELAVGALCKNFTKTAFTKFTGTITAH